MRRRHELSDEQWERIEPLLPPERGRRGRPANPNRIVVNGIVSLRFVELLAPVGCPSRVAELGRLPRRAHRRVRSTCGHLDRLRQHGSPTRQPLLNRDCFCVPCSPFLFLVPSLKGERDVQACRCGEGQCSRGFAARFCKQSLVSRVRDSEHNSAEPDGIGEGCPPR